MVETTQDMETTLKEKVPTMKEPLEDMGVTLLLKREF